MNRTAPYQIEMEHPIPHAENLSLIDKCYHAIPPSIVNANAADIVTDNYTPDAAQKLDLKYKGFWANALHDLATFGEEVSKGVSRGVIDIVGGYGTLAVEAGAMIKDGSARRYSKKLAELTPWGMLSSFGESLMFEKMGGDDENSALYKKQQQLGDLFVKTGKAVEKFADYAVNTPELKPSEEIFSGSFFENPSATRAASILMGAVPSLLVLSGMNKIAGPVAAYTVFNMGDNADILKETRDREDISDEKRRGLFAAGTAGTMLMDLYTKPLELIFGKQHAWLKGLSSKMSRAGLAALTEGGNEVGQQYWQNFVKHFGYDATQSLLEGVFESFIAGAVAGGAGRLGTDMQYQKIADKINANMKPDENGVMPKPATVKDVEDALNAILPGIDKDGKVSEAFYQGILEQLSKFDQMMEKLGDSPEGQRLKQWKREINSIGEQLAKAYEPYLQGSEAAAEDMGGVRIPTENEPTQYQAPASKMATFDDFYDDVMADKSFARYFRQNIGGYDVDVMSDRVTHDKNKHGLTKDEWKGIFQALNDGKIIEAEKGNLVVYHGFPMKIVVDVNGTEYGLNFEHVPSSGRNFISSAFKYTDKQWMKGGNAQTIARKPLSTNGSWLGHSLQDIMAYIDGEIKAGNFVQKGKAKTAQIPTQHQTRVSPDDAPVTAEQLRQEIKAVQAWALFMSADTGLFSSPMEWFKSRFALPGEYESMGIAPAMEAAEAATEETPTVETVTEGTPINETATKDTTAEEETATEEPQEDLDSLIGDNEETTQSGENLPQTNETTPEGQTLPSEENAAQESEKVGENEEENATDAENKGVVENPRETGNDENAKPETQKIEDFGEKIEGARKDIWARRAEILRRAAEMSDFSGRKFTEIFPKPNYDKMIANGFTTDTVAALEAYRDTLAFFFKKYGTSGMKGDYFREMLAKAAKIMDGSEKPHMPTPDDFTRLDVLRDSYGAFNDLHSMLEWHLYNNIRTKVLLGYPKSTMTKLFVGDRRGNFYVHASPYSYYRQSFSSFDDALAYLNQLDGLDKKVDGVKTNVKNRYNYAVYIDRESGKCFIGRRTKSAVIRIKEGFKDSYEARDYIKEHRDELDKISDEKKKIRDRGEENRPRVGEDYLNGGNISIKGFEDAFKFRGVQFGNYVEQGRRQEDMNNAYNSLTDLAKILNIPTQAISLNGKLGLAFGARGQGGANAASAHYEPMEVVINLTKRKGAGSLAHEWFHALDNYLPHNVYNSLSELRHVENVRKELVDAFKELHEVLEKSEMKKASKQAGDYWSSDVEMAARAFESYVIDKMKRKGFVNDYLANIREESGVYPHESDKAAVYAAFDRIFDTLKVKPGDNGSYVLYQSDQAQNNRLAKEREAAKEYWFKPSKDYIRRYNEAINNAVRNSNPTGSLIHIADKTPNLYVMLGMPNLPLKMRQNILNKVVKDKHNVSLKKTMYNFPELFCDPIMVVETKHKDGNGMIAILDSADEKDKIVAAVIKKGKGEYNIIPSAHGKDYIEGFLRDSKVLYTDDERISKVTDISTLLLRDWNNRQTKSSLINKLALVRANVNYQNTAYKGDIAERARGAMMTLPDGRQTIALFKSANASTFIHEAGHLFLSDLEKYAGQNAKVSALLLRTRGWQDGEFNRLYNVKLRDDGRYIVTDKRSHTVYDNMESGFATAADAADYAKSELFARGFEKYCARGQAPTSFLDKTFAMFKKWLARMKSIVADEVKLNDDILSVYDRIFTAGSETGEDLEFYTAESDEKAKRQFEELKEARRKNREAALLMAVDTANEPVPASEAFKPMRDITKSRQGLGEWWTKYIVPIDTRAMNVSEGLWARLQRYEFNLGVKMNRAVAQAEPFLKLWQKMTPEDTLTLDLILKNQAVNEEQPNEEMTKRRNAILDKYEGGREAYDAVVALLEKLRSDGMAVGMDIGKLTDYFPRKVKYYNELMAELMNDPAMAEPINRAIAEAKRANANITDDELAEVIDKFIRSGAFRGKSSRINPGATKARTVEGIDNVLNQYYEPSDQALLKHIASMIEATENRKIWGYDRQTAAQEAEATQAEDKSFGAIIAAEMAKDGVIDATETKEAAAILNARLGEHGVSNPALKFLRDLAYVYTMGGVNTALRQLDDTAMAIYKAGLWPTLKTVFGKKEVTKKDLGIDSIAEEFAEATRMSKFLEKLFTWNGINLIDAFGKNLLTNSVLTKYRDMARNNPNELAKRIKYLEDETVSTVADFAEGKLTDNVKFVLFNELADVQPITKSQMPEGYLTGGNMRVVYSLKTFLIRRMNTVARDAGKLIKQGIMTKDFGTFAKGFANFTRLAALCIMAGGGADWLIDLLYGRKFDIQDSILDNILGLFMLNRYTLYNARDRGPEAMIASSVIPPILSVPWDFGSDVYNTLFTDKKLKDAQSLKGVPIIGRFYYWWFGKGVEIKEKQEKRRRREARKKAE